MAAAPTTLTTRRFAFSCAYCWGWMRQQENLQLGIPQETAKRFPRRLQELCGYSVYKGQFGHIDNHDPIELLGPRTRKTHGVGSDGCEEGEDGRGGEGVTLCSSLRGAAERKLRRATAHLRIHSSTCGCGAMESGSGCARPGMTA